MAYGAIMGQALATSGGTSPFGMCGPLTCYVGDGNYTFTAQMKGKYKVTAISGGGDGGNGSNTGDSSDRRRSGAGGGSGAIAGYIEALEVNNTINIVITNGAVNIGGGKLYLTAGTDGQAGRTGSSSISSPSAGIGGTITRSSVDLLFSANGNPGETGNSDDNINKGGALSMVIYYPVVRGGKQGIYLGSGQDGLQGVINSIPTGPIAYGGYVGVGGPGAVILYTGGSSISQEPPGGKGGPAAVIIEYLGDF